MKKLDIPKIWSDNAEEKIHAEDAMYELTEEIIDQGSYCDETILDMKKCIEYLVDLVKTLELLK